METAKLYLETAKRAAEKWSLKNGDNYSNSVAVPVQNCAVIGGGAMGGGIVLALVAHGFRSYLIDINQTAVDSCKANVRAMIERQLPGDVAEVVWSRLHWSTCLEKASDVDLVIEAVYEEMPLKKQVFSKLSAICKVARATSRPELVIGMHFFIPADRTSLIEVVQGERTSGKAVATVFDVTKRLGKLPVLVGNCPGFVANRMAWHYFQGAMDLVDKQGFLPHQVDDIMRGFGFALGPFQMADLIGKEFFNYTLQDGYTAASELGTELARFLIDRKAVLRRKARKKNWYAEDGDSTSVLFVHYTYKVGRGWYMYDPISRHRMIDPDVVSMVRSYCPKQQKASTDTEVVEFCLFPLVNEGFKILAEGIVANISDPDLIW